MGIILIVLLFYLFPYFLLFKKYFKALSTLILISMVHVFVFILVSLFQLFMIDCDQPPISFVANIIGVFFILVNVIFIIILFAIKWLGNMKSKGDSNN
jgi:hypothetical protein